MRSQKGSLEEYEENLREKKTEKALERIVLRLRDIAVPWMNVDRFHIPSELS